MHCIVLSGNEETAIRLGAALILGGMLGLDRELHGKPAGLRTYALSASGRPSRRSLCSNPRTILWQLIQTQSEGSCKASSRALDF